MREHGRKHRRLRETRGKREKTHAMKKDSHEVSARVRLSCVFLLEGVHHLLYALYDTIFSLFILHGRPLEAHWAPAMNDKTKANRLARVSFHLH